MTVLSCFKYMIQLSRRGSLLSLKGRPEPAFSAPDVVLSNRSSITEPNVQNYPGCIGFIDGTLCRCRRPFNNSEHSRWFNGRKKVYCLNSIVVVDHDGLFIYIDPSYPGSYHNVNLLRNSDLYHNWRSYFSGEDETSEFLLGDPGYMGMFIMRLIADQEIPQDADAAVIQAFNKLHAGRRIRVEWGIGGLKWKWRRFMRCFDNTKPRSSHMFTIAYILTNFLHRRRRDMTAHDLGAYVGLADAPEDIHGWAEE